MTPDTGLATLVSSLSTTGLEAYEVSQGQPVSISSVAGVGTVSVGNPFTSLFTGFTGTFIVIVLAIIGIAYAFKKSK